MDPFSDFLRHQEKAWLDARQQWALGFLDRLMQDIARYNTGTTAGSWMANRLLQYSYVLAEKAEEVRSRRFFMPPDEKELNLWLDGFKHYRFGLRELEVYLTNPDPSQANQARRALSQGSLLLARAMALAYARLGFS